MRSRYAADARKSLNGTNCSAVFNSSMPTRFLSAIIAGMAIVPTAKSGMRLRVETKSALACKMYVKPGMVITELSPNLKADLIDSEVTV